VGGGGGGQGEGDGVGLMFGQESGQLYDCGSGGEHTEGNTRKSVGSVRCV